MNGAYSNLVNRFHRDLRLKVELPKPNWVQNAQIVHVYKHPIMWGTSKRTKSNKITDNVFEEIFLHKFKLWNGMFVVYDQETQCIQNCVNSMVMNKVQMIPIDSKIVIFKCDMMIKDLVLDLGTLHHNIKLECHSTICDKFMSTEMCIDCGNQAAMWFDRIWKNKKLRLGFCLPQQSKDTTFLDNYSHLRETHNDDRNILMNRWDVPMITIVSLQSANNVKYNVSRTELERDFKPDLIISCKQPFEEHEWKWIKIEDAIFRNIRRFPPKGIINIKNMPTDMKWQMLPTYWEMYSPGYVSENVDVLVHMPQADDYDMLLD